MQRVRIAIVAAFVIFECASLVHAQAPSAPDLIEIKKVDPTIIIDLRYASDRNIAHRPIYPANFAALVRPFVAERLVAAQSFLRANGYGLKIWDAYRPKDAQSLLWSAARNESYVANPAGEVGSMHTRGAAVDATLVDRNGHDVAMPTDFDNFTPAAWINYGGNDPGIRFNLLILQRAMARAGFYGLRTEWWHFCAADWTKYPPIELASER